MAAPAVERARRSVRVARWVLLVVALLGLGVFAVWSSVADYTYPSDRTPEGAYLRVVNAVAQGRPELFFPYLETRAQHACYTTRDYRRRSRELVLAAYPEPERTRLATQWAAAAAAPDGADLFAAYARERRWLDRLRRDASGVRRVEIIGERATVETALGTRYPFRRRENGIWGLTLFTSALDAEAERAARDFQQVESAASDYRRAATPSPSSGR